MIVRRIGVLSAAKLGGFVGLFSGVILGLLLALTYVAGGDAQQAVTASGSPVGIVAQLGSLAIVALPLVYAVVGAIVAAMHALLYNVAAKLAGGLRLELK